MSSHTDDNSDGDNASASQLDEDSVHYSDEEENVLAGRVEADQEEAGGDDDGDVRSQEGAKVDQDRWEP